MSIKLITSRFVTTAILVASLGATSIAAPNMYGSRGTMRTHSAKTLGNGKIVIGASVEGSTDGAKLVDKSFHVLDTTLIARDAEGNLLRSLQKLPNGEIINRDSYWMNREDYENLSLESQSSPDSLANIEPDGQEATSVNVREVIDFTFRPFIAVGLTNYFDLGIALPVHVDRITSEDADTQHDLNNISGAGVGDLEIWGKFQYPPYEHEPVFDMAFFGMVTVPTGNTNTGFVPKEIYYIPNNQQEINSSDLDYRTKFFSSEQISATLLMLWTLDFYHIERDFPLEVNLNYGMTTTVNKNLDNVFVLNTSALYHINQLVGIYAEFAGQTRFSKLASGFALGSDPMNFNLGAQLTTGNGMFITLGVDIGISAPATSELDTLSVTNDDLQLDGSANNDWTYYRIQPVTNTAFTAVIGWEGFIIPQDADKDGIIDKYDSCKETPEDLDGFEDHDGCPEEDNDEDGVEDIEDNCPFDPEDIDGFEDKDGCPEFDNDKDGIKDKLDECPNLAEDINNFRDEDGCPEGSLDTDEDGIPDINDRCKEVPEDIDGFEDFDGCPEADNDNDGFLDAVDKCPNKAEMVNGYLDDDGCPDMKPRPKKKPMKKKAKIVLHGVTFETGKATLEHTSYEKLADVGQTLIENPEVLIEISGHTDNRGSKKLNQKLSEERAESVVKYLLSLGVGKNQLTSVGYGPDKPSATNRTAEGRQENRRIEMMRLK